MNKKHIEKPVCCSYNGSYRRWYSLININTYERRNTGSLLFFQKERYSNLSVKVDQSYPCDRGKFKETCKQPLRMIPSSLLPDPTVCHIHFLMQIRAGKISLIFIVICGERSKRE